MEEFFQVMQSTNLRREDSCQESGLLWIYLKPDPLFIFLCIRSENNFLLHHHTSQRSRRFPVC